MPHKPAAAGLLRSCSDRARIAGAANVLRPCAGGWDGDLFDGEGFALGLEANGHAVEGLTCSIVGAGGAGAAIALALVERKAEVALWDIDRRKASRLAERLVQETGASVTVAPPGPGSDLAVNATPLGMHANDPLPFAVGSLRRDAIVAEAVMKPPVTRLLEAAKRHGCQTQEGRHMLDAQVPAIWAFFGLP